MKQLWEWRYGSENDNDCEKSIPACLIHFCESTLFFSGISGLDLILLRVFVFLFLFAARCTHTSLFKGACGAVVPNSVATMEQIKIGGVFRAFGSAVKTKQARSDLAPWWTGRERVGAITYD
jgi:hypothetical protein